MRYFLSRLRARESHADWFLRVVHGGQRDGVSANSNIIHIFIFQVRKSGDDIFCIDSIFCKFHVM